MEDNRRRTTSVRQLELLITFMESHTSFAVGQLRSKEGRALAARMWNQCADILNSEGIARTAKDWSKFWNDYKCRVRTKIAEINRGYTGTGGGPSRAPQLSPLEERVAALIGRDVGPLSGVRQDPEIVIEYVNTGDMDVEENVELPLTNSPILDISVIPDRIGATGRMSPVSPPTQDLSQTATIESEPTEPEPAHVEVHNQPADQGAAAPQPEPPRLRQPRPPRPRAAVRPRPRFVHQNNTTALDEARATIAHIEEMRARTEEMVATAALNISNAMTGISTAMTSMAESLQTYLAISHRVNTNEDN